MEKSVENIGVHIHFHDVPEQGTNLITIPVEQVRNIFKEFLAEYGIKCKSGLNCSHNTNGRDLDKPCSVELK